jgi:hypothetical protein
LAVFGEAPHDGAAAVARDVLGDARNESAVDAIGFTGAASGLFAATHAVLAIRDGELSEALVWQSDRGARNLAIVLAAP